jgi:cytochrome c oxidase subunit 3
MERIDHFASYEQEKDAAELGIWVFLASEALFFSGLFLALTVYRILYPEAFHEGTREMHFWLGTVNTGILLTSSFTMATAVRLAPERGRRWLFLTALLGLAFLVVKGVEYHQEWLDGMVPVLHFDPNRFASPHTVLFLFLYFVMTLIHALHLLIGIGLVSWLGLGQRKKKLRVEVVGIYWHFVDLVWVFLYPALYLLGRS